MARWTFEPGHTAVGFRARHMMVTWVRGHFKDVHGTMEFDIATPADAQVQVVIDVSKLWTGESDRDAHLKSADFFDAASYPRILFTSKKVEQVAATQYKVLGDLTIRGVTRREVLDVHYLGEWETPYWEDGQNKGPVTRAGFTATTTINRQDYNVSWNSSIARNGIVVGNEIIIDIDVEALKDWPRM